MYEHRFKKVHFLDDHFCIDMQNSDNSSTYYIHKTRVDSCEKCVIWLAHLSAKTWFDRERAYEFLLMFSKVNNVDLYKSV